MGFFWGVPVSDRPSFGDVRTKHRPETREIFTGCSDTLSQSIGRGRISREGSLVVRESRYWIEKNFAEKNAVWPEMLASSNSSFAQRIFIVLAAEEPTLWGRGYNFKTGWQVTIVGHVQACSTRFLAQTTLYIYILKKVAK